MDRHRTHLKSIKGLIDEIDPEDYRLIEKLVIKEVAAQNLSFHSLRCRNSGQKKFIEFHLLFPKGTPIEVAEQHSSLIEKEIQAQIASDLSIHLQSI